MIMSSILGLLANVLVLVKFILMVLGVPLMLLCIKALKKYINSEK